MNYLSEATSETSEASLQIVVDEPMSEASQTSKRVREPNKEGKETEKKQKCSEEEELNSCVAHLREIVKELEEGERKNIPEVLGIPATEHAERAGGTMIALAGSTRNRASIPSTSRKFYREREQFVPQTR